MKIRLTASTNLKLAEHLSDVDVRYGFSYFDTQNTQGSILKEVNHQNSFSMKVLSALDKVFGALPGEKKFAEAVAGAVDYANRNVDAASLENMSVQINNDTVVSRGLNKFLGLFHKNNPLANKELYDHDAGFIQIGLRHIRMGSNVYQNEALSYQRDLHRKIGKERVAEFVFFHELGHSLEYSTKTNHYPPEFQSLVARIYNIFYSPHAIEQLNEHLKNKELEKNQTSSPDTSIHSTHSQTNARSYRPIDRHFLKNLNSLREEIYSDTTSVLMNRNYDIDRDLWSKDKTAFHIESIIESRKQSIIDHGPTEKTYDNVKRHVHNFNHFTSPGLEGLIEKLDSLGNRPLSQAEIHQFAQEAVMQGLSRMFQISANMNNDIVGQLNTLFDAQFNADTGAIEVNPEASTEHYREMMGMMKGMAGKQWMETFSANREKLKTSTLNHSPESRMLAVFTLGTNPAKFEADLNAAYNHNKQAMEHPAVKDAYLDNEMNNQVPAMRAKHSIMEKMAQMREQAFGSGHKNNNTLKI